MTTIGKVTVLLVIASGLMTRCQAQMSGAAPATQSTPGAFMDVEGSKLYYAECGTGPEAVILLHDGIAHSAVADAPTTRNSPAIRAAKNGSV